MNIATLTIEMAANVARLRQDMDNAASVVQGATAKMQKAAELAGKALGLLGVGLSMTAITGFIRNAIDAADALDEMSGRVGVGARELSALQLAYKQAGMGNDAMASSLAKLSRQMSEGNAGLRALGVNARNADGSLRGTTEVLLDVADKFTRLEDGAAKTALAIEIFGKSGVEMVPLLNSGSDGIAKLMDQAVKLGLVIEDSTAAQAGQFNDTLELLGLGVQGVGTRIAAQLLPTLTNLTASFLESMTSGDRLKGVADFLAASLKILYTVGLGIVEVFSTVGKTLGAAMGQVMAILRGDFAQASAIGKEWQKDVTAGWSATSAAVQAAWSAESNAAVVSAATTMKVSKDLLAEEKAREEAAMKAKAASDKAAEEAKKRAEDGAKLAASLLAQDSGLAGDFAEKWEKLSAAYAANGISLEVLTAAQRELLEQQPLMKKAFDDAAKASQAAADARKKEADGIDAFIRAQEEAAAATLKAIRDRITGLQDEEQAAEMARSLNIGLAEAVERVAIARKLEEQARFSEGSDGWERVRREIEEREKLLALIAKKDVREREERGWTDMWSSVDRTAHDVFVNVFEGGSNVFKKLGQTLKASVLDVLYQMTVRRWMINIGTSIFGGGFGAAAQAATGGGGLLSGIGSIGSGYSLLSGLGGAFGGGMAGGFGGLLGSLGLSGAGTTLGGALSAGSIALQSGNILGGLGTFAGALGPIALGIGALVSLLGKDTSGTFHTGALSEYSAATGAANSTAHGAFGMGFGGVDFSAQSQQFTAGLAKSITQLLDGTAATFGKDGGYRVATAFADDTSDDGAWGGLLIRRMEETILNWDDTRTSRWAPKEFANGEQGQKEYLAALGSSVREALDSIGLPGWATTMLDALGEGASIEQLAGVVAQINNVKAVFADFGQYMPTFASLADAAISKLARASGGVEALTANMSTFVANFFSEEERLAVATANVAAELAKLGFEMPRTRDEYKAMVQAQLALGDGGAATAARLLALSGAFAGVVTGADSAAESTRALAEQLEQQHKAAVDSIYSSFRRALAQDRAALNDEAAKVRDTISGITDVVSMLRSNSRDLALSVDSTAQMMAAQGMVYVEQALAGVRAGASVTDYANLADAISAARGGIDKGAYVSQFERDRDALVLAGQLADLGDLGDLQLTVEERQLKGINDQLEYLDSLDRRADALVNGTVELTDTVSGYFMQLLALLAPEKPEAGGGSGSSSGSPFVIGGGGGGGGGGGFDQAELKAQSIRDYVGMVYKDSTDYADPHSLAQISASAYLSNWSLKEMSEALDVPAADIVRMMEEAGLSHWRDQLPAFATGGAFTNGIVSRPSFFNIGQMGEGGQSEGILPLANVGGRLGVYSMGGGNAEVVAELQALRMQFGQVQVRLAAIDVNTEGLPQMVDHTDQVTEGGIGTRTEIVNVAPLASAIAKEIAKEIA